MLLLLLLLLLLCYWDRDAVAKGFFDVATVVVLLLQLCKAAVTAINTDGNKALETLPGTYVGQPQSSLDTLSNASLVEVKIDDVSTINYQLVDVPTLTTGYIETNHKVKIK